MMNCARLAGAALCCVAAFGQAGTTPPKFEIADVHSRAPNAILSMRSGFSRGRYELRNATMVDLVRTAWSVPGERVLGGPAWLETDRYDVVALAPPNTSPDTLKAMLQELLRDRFRLAAHRAMRDEPAYALRTGNEPRLRHASGSEEPGCRLKTRPLPRAVPDEPVEFECRNMTMAALSDALPRMRGASGYLFNYPLTDRTQLPGAWDFDIKWTARVAGPRPVQPGSATTLFDAFEKQLGLRFELIRMPMPVVIVDSVNENPGANPAGVAERLPAPTLEFEVADIKPAGPDDPIHGASISIQRGGLVRIHMTLKELIDEGWSDMSSERILGGPKAMNDTAFVVTAKAPLAELDAGPGVFSGIDIDSMRAMVRAMLADRFGLAVHEEQRPVTGYALVAARPKLQKADTRNRPSCKEGPGDDGKDPRMSNAMAPRLVTCRNMSLTEFAAALYVVAEDYLHAFPPVVNATDIAGRFDFTLNFSPARVSNSAPVPLPNDNTVSMDPSGAISLFEALPRQLGLRLVSRTVTARVLVIDSVNEMPTEN